MKALSIFIRISITFYLTDCMAGEVPIKVASVASSPGGNPEVNLNLCLQKTHENKVKCLDRIFPNSPSILLLPQGDGKRILLAGRGESIEKAEVTVKESNLLLINLDTINVKVPLSSNVKLTKKSQKGNNLILAIAIKDIEDKVTLKDKEGNIVFDYTIIKK